MFRFWIVSALTLALTLGATVTAAHATPAEQAWCSDGSHVPQDDLTGVYVSPVHQMRVEILSCGGAIVTWDNAYGRHTAGYVTSGRLNGDGIMAGGTMKDPLSGTYLDGSQRIAFKAAEPGFILVGTFGLYDDTITTYRLKKIA